MPEAEVEALYALRCSFAHEYGLTNVNTPLRTHHFRLGASPEDPLVQLPDTSWPGTAVAASPENQTTVNLRGIGDLTERIAGRVRAFAEEGTLRLARPPSEVILGFVVVFGSDISPQAFRRAVSSLREGTV